MRKRRYNFRNFTYLCVSYIAVFVLTTCSSVNTIKPSNNLDLTSPRIKASLLQGGGSNLNDYKIRTSRKPQMILGVYQKENVNKEEAKSHLNDVVKLLISHKLNHMDIRTVPISLKTWQAVQNRDRDHYYPIFKEHNIDGVLHVELSQKEDDYTVKISLWDPVFASNISSFSTRLDVESKKADTEHQSEIFSVRNVYKFMDFVSGPIARLPKSFKNDFAGFIKKSVQGFVNVQTSAVDVHIELAGNGKKTILGKPPYAAMTLDEGHYSLLAKRKGYADQKIKFHVRAGKRIEHFISYPDSDSVSTVSVLSAPAGQRVSIDGQIVGETPHFITGLAPGSYQLELSLKERDNDEFYVTADAPLEINAGVSPKRILFTSYSTSFSQGFLADDFFSLTAEDGNVRLEDQKEGLRFYNKGVPMSSWVGLVSSPLFLNDFASTLTIEETPNQVISFGIVSGDSGDQRPQILINLDHGVYSILRYKNKKLMPPLASYTSKNKKTNIRELRIEYEKEDQEVSIFIDGSKIYSAPSPELFFGNTSRLVILTRGKSANGNLVAHKFRMYSGPGLSEEE